MGITYDDLKNCAALIREARDLETRLEWYRGMASCPTMATKDIPVQAGRESPDRMGEWMDKISAVVEEYGRKIEAYKDHVLEVELLICAVEDGDRRTILRKRYLDGATWEKISEETHFHERWCRELHDRAMKEIGL